MPIRTRGAKHDAAVPGVVRNEVERVGLFVIGILVVDDFDRRHAGVNRNRHRSAIVGTPRRQIGAEANGDLAFDRDIDEVGAAQPGGGFVHHAGEDGAAAWVIDAHQALHHRRGDGNLITDDGAAVGGEELLKRLLHRISLADIVGPQCRWQGLESRPSAINVVKMPCPERHLIAARHRRLPLPDRCPESYHARATRQARI